MTKADHHRAALRENLRTKEFPKGFCAHVQPHIFEPDEIVLAEWEIAHTEFRKELLENARHCGASLIEYTRRTWSSYMHLTVIRMWLNLRPQKIIHKCIQATENIHRPQKIYTGHRKYTQATENIHKCTQEP